MRGVQVFWIKKRQILSRKDEIWLEEVNKLRRRSEMTDKVGGDWRLTEEMEAHKDVWVSRERREKIERPGGSYFWVKRSGSGEGLVSEESKPHPNIKKIKCGLSRCIMHMHPF